MKQSDFLSAPPPAQFRMVTNNLPFEGALAATASQTLELI